MSLLKMCENMVPSLYTFQAYSTDWPAAFEAAARELGGLLKAELLAIHHIGSTSVPGLAAKPVIDLLPVVRNIDGIDALTPDFENAGFRAWGEYGLPGRRLFTKDNAAQYRTHNVHIYQSGSPEIERHLAFCAYLRAHESARLEYEALKREVYTRFPADIMAYNNGKDAWIKNMETVAIEWYRDCNRHH